MTNLEESFLCVDKPKKKGPPKGFKQSPEFCEKLRLARLGPKNPNWKGEDASVIAGRARALREFPVTPPCQKCGKEKSERHHKDGNTLNNSFENIAFLCRKCHMREDGRLHKLATIADEQRILNGKKGGATRKAKMICKRGHLLQGDNVHVHNGSRQCQSCHRMLNQERYWRLRETRKRLSM